MHEHIEPKKCKHELKYCVKCDEVYCEKCKKEWIDSAVSKIPDFREGIEKWIKRKEHDEPRPYWMKHDIVLCSHRSST